LNIQTALLQGQELLEEARVAAPRLTAEVLLAYAIGCDRAWLYAHSDEELREVWWIHYGRYLHERLKGKPTQYITGRQEFYGRDFRVTPDVLIPRPETEHSVEAALELARHARTIADIGTGSGAIAVTLALELNARVLATDISERAVRAASANSHRLGADVEFVVSDLGSAFQAESFDLVVSNPPYVPDLEKENVQREVRDYEPHVALFGGSDGLDLYRRLIPEAWRLLRPGGWLILEIGFSTAERLRTMLDTWKDVQIKADLAGIPRVVIARKALEADNLL
jgi:release factor glutamine methyltransferase